MDGTLAYRGTTGVRILIEQNFINGETLDGKYRIESLQLLSIVITPLTAIMIALLYLKTRHAGGESLKDATEQFDALEIPRSRWQARMRSRASFPLSTG